MRTQVVTVAMEDTASRVGTEGTEALETKGTKAETADEEALAIMADVGGTVVTASRRVRQARAAKAAKATAAKTGNADKTGVKHKLVVHSVKLSDLKLDPKNVRKHSKKNIAAIRNSLRRFGQQKPIIVDKDYVVRAGNGTLEAAKLLKWDMIDVAISDLPESELIAYAIADNRSAELAEWDDVGLAEQLKSMDEELRNIVFEDFKFPEEPKEGLTDADAIPENIETRCKLGDLWILGEHRLLCGDSTDVLQVERLMGGQKADMAYCDPPYGANIVNAKGKLGGDKPFGKGNKIVKAGNYKPIIGDETTDTAIESFNICAAICSVQVFWGAQYYADRLPPNHGWIVWDKQTDGSLGDGELAYSNLKKAVRIFQHKWSGMIKASEKNERRVHPTQKPIALAEWCFENYGKPKSVLDLFLGSGSTLIACEKTGRKCYGMEIDPHYCDVIIKRWEDFTGGKAELSDSP